MLCKKKQLSIKAAVFKKRYKNEVQANITYDRIDYP